MRCIVCETEGAERFEVGDAGGSVRFNCRRCGSFVLSGTAEATLEPKLNEKPLRRSLMSHKLRRMQQPGDKHLRAISDDELLTFWHAERLPTPQQQADHLILWIGNHQESVYSRIEIDRSEIAAWIGLQISQPDDSTGWIWLDSQLEREQLYVSGQQGRVVSLGLTMDGWRRHQDLKKTNIQSRMAFMAMKFNQSDLDPVVKCFCDAATRTGFELRTLTDEQPAGSIDDQLRARILASRFVIADLTHGSPGAYGGGVWRGIGLACDLQLRESRLGETGHAF
jgi:hypothetical protein